MTGQTVLIAGAGIAGPTLAFWLKAGGFEPTLVERAPRLRTGGYVIDFWGLGYDIAERMGLRDEIDRLGYHMRGLRIVDDRGERVGGFGTNVFSELTGGRYVTIARSDLSRLLFGKVKGEVIFDDEVIRLEQTAKAVRVWFERGGERRFDLVIGADGLRSSVRRLAFGPDERCEKHLGYVVAAFEVNGYRPRDEDVYMLYGQPGRMVGRFALHDDRTLFLFVFTAEGDYLPTIPEAQKAMLREWYCDGQWEVSHILAELERTDELYFERVSQIRMDRWSQGRVALVGDAAFCVSLLAGQGSALAMISAYVLAGELVKAGGRCEPAFAGYEAILRDFIATKQKGAAMFAGAFAPQTRWGLWFRNQVTKAFAIPGLAKRIVGKEIVDSLPLPEYRWPARQG